MLRANFFLNFLKYKKNTRNEIVQYKSNKEFALQEKINIKIIEIDQEISENNKALVEAQIIKLRSIFSKPNNFIEQIGKNVYKTKLEDSIYWHQNQLKELYFQRRDLQINLEKIKGIYWLNRIKRFLRILAIGFLMILGIFIFLSGFMIIIYLLPIIILIFLGFWMYTKKY